MESSNWKAYESKELKCIGIELHAYTAEIIEVNGSFVGEVVLVDSRPTEGFFFFYYSYFL